ncbi:YicC/YloC family endoribonuclease [Risungbinella massiliensis]|uniref:YicC/YloC family endoribonuclease n=1 Tax=Risungbinella massiliensis TaxID=1329796 RepID=UPI0005CC60E3|nr:YicC/YloC family endoribonuclease [Risungbinella massiliensis]
MKTYANIHSMTGFGRAQKEREGCIATVEIRSVNSRFLETIIRMPSGRLQLEEQLKVEVKAHVERGRVEVFVTYSEETKKDQCQVVLDEGLASSYLQAAKIFQEQHLVPGELTIQDLLSVRDLWQVEERQSEGEVASSIILEAFQEALEQMIEMRAVEGKALSDDLLGRLQELEKTLGKIAGYTSEVSEKYRERLQARLSEWLANETISEERVAAEVAILAEKADISEELTRLESHCQQMKIQLQQAGVTGRKLDFLIQEMNREANTIGSKANHQRIASLVVESKSILEKMKEQVQNVE